MLTARITLDNGLLTDDSTVTIGDVTLPVPQRHSGGGIFAPRRILEVIDAMGYRAVNYTSDTSYANADRSNCIVRVTPKAGE